MYYFQLADVNEAERPEYEIHKSSAWITVLEAKTADDLLCLISDWLNDEEYPTSQWTRVVKNNMVLQSGLLVNVER
jgi:hypothetical protein